MCGYGGGKIFLFLNFFLFGRLLEIVRYAGTRAAWAGVKLVLGLIKPIYISCWAQRKPKLGPISWLPQLNHYLHFVFHFFSSKATSRLHTF